MSKSDAQRAMREAKYARNNASASTRAVASADVDASTPLAAQTPKTPARTAKNDAAIAGGQTCGHKSMNGRVCTREAGHAEKNHRYS